MNDLGIKFYDYGYFQDKTFQKKYIRFYVVRSNKVFYNDQKN